MWKLHSSLPRYSNIYTLTVQFKDGTSNASKEEGFKRSVLIIIWCISDATISLIGALVTGLTKRGL